MRVLTIVGARPQFVKAAPVSRVLRRYHQEVLVHTGQHYDHGMSQIFFDELQIPQPDINLGIGSGAHGAQTGRMLGELEQVILAQTPDWVLVYGDTNSTLAGALAAAKLHIPIAHIEAGLRSFNRRMPEEVNRVLTDHVASLLFCPTATAVDNLHAEGIHQGVHRVGDVMYDVVRYYAAAASQRAVLSDLDLVPQAYGLATVHRPRNTDNVANLVAILRAFALLAMPIIFPVHPRTRKVMAAAQVALPANVRAIEPVGYLDMLQLAQGAKAILTDSGGLQKEAYFLGVPCITLRDETEWVETVETGWNTLTGADCDRIVKAVSNLDIPKNHPQLYGDGHAAEHVLTLMEASPCR